ncbi:hypothetical protein HZS_242 [Henneguya salminicola]|nr:hypothetical protein HZS_242 [Henneguya salminicola]
MDSYNVKLKAQFLDDTKHVIVTGDMGAFTPKILAKNLYSGKDVGVDQISRILCRKDAFHHEVCKEYMNMFDFRNLEIDEALRVLMRKIPLIGETHTIERMLRDFTTRYCVCNKDTIELSETTYHLLTCSLLILNCDFYSSTSSKKMSKKKYVQNILNAMLPNDKKPSIQLLKKMYASLKKDTLPSHMYNYK